VWFHTEGAPGRQIGYAGLPIFLLAFFSLITLRRPADTLPGFLRRRWERLLKPWLFWSVVYGVCHLVNDVRMGETGYLQNVLSMGVLVTGTNIHLWYLPYTFLLGIPLYGLTRWTAKVRLEGMILLATGVGVVTLVACALAMTARPLPAPFPQWEFGFAALPVGYAIGTCLRLPRLAARRLLLALLSAAVGATCLLLIAAGHGGMGISYGLATPLVCLAYVWPGSPDLLATTVAPLTLGIYLIHPLVGYALSLLAPPGPPYVLLIAANVGLSGLLTFALKATVLRRFV
jgi:surface polysaccharide O-acyltransferase-like enzyme